MESEEEEPEAKRRRLQCVDFAAVASCDVAVAQCYLAENDWEMEVRPACLPPPRPASRSARPTVCLCFSEGAGLVLRAAGGGERLGEPPVGARGLVRGSGMWAPSGRRAATLGFEFGGAGGFVPG